MIETNYFPHLILFHIKYEDVNCNSNPRPVFRNTEKFFGFVTIKSVVLHVCASYYRKIIRRASRQANRKSRGRKLNRLL